jgi:hypothetical protein
MTEKLGTPYHADEAMSYDIGINLSLLMHEVKMRKNSAVGDVIPRRWAVLYTELEKSLGYYQAFLESKPSVEGGS